MKGLPEAPTRARLVASRISLRLAVFPPSAPPVSRSPGEDIISHERSRTGEAEPRAILRVWRERSMHLSELTTRELDALDKGHTICAVA